MISFYKKIINNKNNLMFFVWLSVVLHGLVLFIVLINFVFTKFSFKKPKPILMAVRVDTIALPDYIPKQKPHIKKKSIKKKPLLISKKEKSFLKKKKKRKTHKKKNTASKKLKDNLKKQTVHKKQNKGNKLSKGGKTGDNIISKQVLSSIYHYTAQIKNIIRSHWNLPKYLTDIHLIVQIELKINPDGSVFYQGIDSSSGNDLFDTYVLRVISKSAPFPAPPDVVKKYVQDEGFVLSVPSRQL